MNFSEEREMFNRYVFSMNSEYVDSAVAAWEVIRGECRDTTAANDMLFYLFGDGM